MSPTNRALVQHTWGLHELQMSQFSQGNSRVSIHGARREHAQILSYGPQFVYDEFVITRSSFIALVYGVGYTVIRFMITYSPLVS
jgi:hypothetical protein